MGSNEAVQLELLLGYLQKEFGQKPSEALVIAETMKAWRQKPKQTFKEAYDEFYELYDKSSKPEPEAVDLFISGLQRQLRDEIYRKNTDPRSFSAIKDIGFDAEVIVMRARKHPLDEEEESDAEMTRPSKPLDMRYARSASNLCQRHEGRGHREHQGDAKWPIQTTYTRGETPTVGQKQGRRADTAVLLWLL
mmetsp:Transcript_37284/g.106671  ORF Transcript_37284/g.106671 Transcript_37284/m.106671 type:complete len:192 (+) Transcript_37284:501-1076(+)